MHIGCGKVGNVQRTRPYVTGRVFWGALTMRLTRDECEKDNKPATKSKDYQDIGKKVNELLAYTYFYPATSQNAQIDYPWKNESQFRRRFLSSYASTALVYPQQAADEGLLHEVEFISPRTLDTGEQVYLIGYVFEEKGCDLKWKDACKRLQMGGERGYGWGDVQCVEVEPITDTQSLKSFGENYFWEEHQAAQNSSGIQNSSVVIQMLESGHLLAHTVAQSVSAEGEIEPLVGREWRSNNSTNRYAGQHVEKFCDPCWVPGSIVDRSNFVIQDFGIWWDSNGRSS
jgi:hypothetical protein